jgi:hypothetical protein
VLILDAHAHLYTRFPPDAIRRRIDDAFRAAADRAPDGDAPPALALLLAERAGETLFQQILDRGGPEWQFDASSRPINENRAVLMRGGWLGAHAAILAAGRQVRTASGLELQAVGLRGDEVPDGLDAFETADAIRARGAQAAIVWGVGKWMGRRAKVVRELLRTGRIERVIDTAMRPRGWPPHRVLRGGPDAPRVWRGSDPLDRPGEERRLAQYGSLHDGPWPSAASLEAALATLDGAACRPWGRRRSWIEVAATVL